MKNTEMIKNNFEEEPLIIIDYYDGKPILYINKYKNKYMLYYWTYENKINPNIMVIKFRVSVFDYKILVKLNNKKLSLLDLYKDKVTYEITETYGIEENKSKISIKEEFTTDGDLPPNGFYIDNSKELNKYIFKTDLENF